MLPGQAPEHTTVSEKAMFALIRDAPGSQGYFCLHSLGIAKHRRKDYAEADFVLITSAGIYCIEVKGGQVERRSGLWHIGWPGRSYTSAEGPFKQAQGSRWALLDYLDQRLGKGLRADTNIGWGVAFPDIIFDRKDPEWDLELVYDQRDKGSSFAKYVERIAEYFATKAEESGKRRPFPMSAARVQQIVEALRGDFDIVPSLRGLLLDSNLELVSLSADQHQILDLALNDANPRIMCDGAAGTGKTLVAVEAARRLSKAGKSVLLLCYNDNLSRFLKLDMAQSGGRVRVATIHSFLGDVIRSGGFEGSLKGSRAETDTEQHFHSVYPQLFESACEVLMETGEMPQFDVLVVDEAQDILNPSIMGCLDLALNGGMGKGQWVIFHDSGLQSAVYDRADQTLISRLRERASSNLTLTDNFRNPRAVVTEACLMSGAHVPRCRRSISSPVDYRVAIDERDAARKLRALVLELFKEGVTPRQISIISPLRYADSCVGKFSLDVGKPVQEISRSSAEEVRDAVTVGTIAGFKGLENDVIILTDLPDEPNTERDKALLYVGMTRARTKLFAVVTEGYINARSRR